eukprot:CAMPEP_0206470866 /NCGR_PEP_ID=MMETSP0324_2-20121206/31202_1 /ASSEMBLY_ACC=CAM_ASM_000836 /TAXON_ID=2866 /ORGANISM="Crypthecodinium cohnii, Strain Seligo" /LENGTH=116 /DNA_ID=CAMNT_0053945041 /DNA_START=261 /DNA_END=608 /DNA_ORIENTATION=-
MARIRKLEAVSSKTQTTANPVLQTGKPIHSAELQGKHSLSQWNKKTGNDTANSLPSWEIVIRNRMQIASERWPHSPSCGSFKHPPEFQRTTVRQSVQDKGSVAWGREGQRFECATD